ncbi:MAG: M48 family metallopeptidase [Candidatus Aminicenantes bacterium]|nr:M48 family metallopeptidase [Candidatus Aminicenantes bacterium]
MRYSKASSNKQHSRCGFIRLDGRNIVYVAVLSRRAKHVRLSLEPGGRLKVVLPSGRRKYSIPDILEKNRRWIIKNLDNLSRKNRPDFPLTFADGSALPLLNSLYRIKIIPVTGNTESFRWNGRFLELRLRDRTPSRVRTAVIVWYKEMSRLYLDRRIPVLSAKMMVRPGAVRVKNQRTLWGSCSRKGNLNFNWRLMLLTPETADYLIIHELAHLLHLNHSKRFWHTIEKYCPEYKKHKAELREKNSWLEQP